MLICKLFGMKFDVVERSAAELMLSTKRDAGTGTCTQVKTSPCTTNANIESNRIESNRTIAKNGNRNFTKTALQ